MSRVFERLGAGVASARQARLRGRGEGPAWLMENFARPLLTDIRRLVA
jgi:hypothetical protein